MKRWNVAFFVAAALSMLALAAFADEAKEGMPEMGPMGQPPEMKEIEFLVGTWDADMKMRMSAEATEWIPTKGVATYAFVLDGCAMHMNYAGEAMEGMPAFSGAMIQCYDRELKQWQAAWVDNMSARMSVYTGHKMGDTTMLEGIDVYMGQTLQTHLSTFNHKPGSFDWKMEHSMDGGKTFWTAATATYTKRK